MSASSFPTSRQTPWILFERVSVGHDYVVRGIFSTEEDARLAAFDNGAPSYGCQEPGNEDSWVFNAFPYEIDDVLWSEGYRTE